MVRAYQEFKDKNFTVVGVSLDQKKDAWLEAIHADRSFDLDAYQRSWFLAKQGGRNLQFNAIPYNVLLDPQGRILAIGLWATP